VYDSFVEFMIAVVLPLRAANPDAIRLDGALSGGSRNSVGRFLHDGREWVVHEDTHFEPLQIAFQSARVGSNPFVEEATDRGLCLSLRSDLRATQTSPHKYMYIYSWK